MREALNPAQILEVAMNLKKKQETVWQKTQGNKRQISSKLPHEGGEISIINNKQTPKQTKNKQSPRVY